MAVAEPVVRGEVTARGSENIYLTRLRFYTFNNSRFSLYSGTGVSKAPYSQLFSKVLPLSTLILFACPNSTSWISYGRAPRSTPHRTNFINSSPHHVHTHQRRHAPLLRPRGSICPRCKSHRIWTGYNLFRPEAVAPEPCTTRRRPRCFMED